MKINEATTKIWSRIGSRATFGMIALELGDQIDDLIILSGDTSTSAGLQRFKSTFPDKFLDVGISEQNMIAEKYRAQGQGKKQEILGLQTKKGIISHRLSSRCPLHAVQHAPLFCRKWRDVHNSQDRRD